MRSCASRNSSTHSSRSSESCDRISLEAAAFCPTILRLLLTGASCVTTLALPFPLRNPLESGCEALDLPFAPVSTAEVLLPPVPTRFGFSAARLLGLDLLFSGAAAGSQRSCPLASSLVMSCRLWSPSSYFTRCTHEAGSKSAMRPAYQGSPGSPVQRIETRSPTISRAYTIIG